MAAAALCFLSAGGQAWGQTGAEPTSDKAAIVAAGFGYQNEFDSSITVKVYDAISGEVLSEDVYELSIKEDRNGARAHASNGRIFAGGVGPGATDLSNFMLRVYDAKTGEFQWAGQLNLTPNEGGKPGHTISTLVPRRAVVTKVEGAEADAQQPHFLLRAFDASTGGVVWEDEFSTDGKGVAKGKLIAARQADEGLQQADTFDFRVRMFGRDGQTILWEDQVLQWAAEEESQDVDDDRARLLPAWTGPITQDAASEEI
ncbi:MAG: hypothetical protein FJ247_06640 [Nitrospira sp.]|nr:hypothetical protein [Nitrospira sp.]